MRLAARIETLTWLLAVVAGLAALLVVRAPVEWTPRRLAGIAGILLVQFVVMLVARFGPTRWVGRAWSGPVFAVGTVFAAIYLAVLLAQWAWRWQTPVNVLVLFVLAAGIGGLIRYRADRRVQASALAGAWTLLIGTAWWSLGWLAVNLVTWGSSTWFAFWEAEAFWADFQRSGTTDVGAYILEDLTGALIFHPVLSVVIGFVVGALVATAAHVVPRRSSRGPHVP